MDWINFTPIFVPGREAHPAWDSKFDRLVASCGGRTGDDDAREEENEGLSFESEGHTMLSRFLAYNFVGRCICSTLAWGMVCVHMLLVVSRV